MNNTQTDKEKLVRYLYPTKEIKNLMLNDVYQELLEFIDIDTCVGEDNLHHTNRQINLNFVLGEVKGF